tara:strand:+ start:3223 stop:3642 length:420 start_codon:yes stop_codon:yes gene_type:complete
MSGTEYNDEWPKTGTPAHNKSQPRGVHMNDSSPLDDKYPAYIPDPACMECGGMGWVYNQITRFDADGEPDFVDVEREPCDCIFGYMGVVADINCRACEGSGEVEEVYIKDNETVAKHYSCLCLRYVPLNAPNNEGEGVD